MGRLLARTMAGSAIGWLWLGLIVAAGAHASPHRLLLPGPDIPRTIPTQTVFIMTHSDTLTLNGEVLRRGVDYTFDQANKAFQLADAISTGLSSADTLVVSYVTLPGWVSKRYGRELPSIRPPVPTNVNPPITSSIGRREPLGSQINITGAKTFRFSAQSSGTSDFGQSLDLNVSGQLTPGVELIGTISDRGLDPAYGTANSRVSELDRVNLTLQSKFARAQIGDITVQPDFLSQRDRSKRVSGASMQVDHPHYRIDAVAARPKGHFQSVQFRGTDALQGPYQINGTSRMEPVVPGSETVYLDGRAMTRGANDDYIVDYATGQITFNVNHPIDRRSRIEIDFEPLATAYKGELFVGGGGVAAEDSLVFAGVSWTREGDDKEQPLAGDFSESDLGLLRVAGDSALLAVRAGVRVDSTGDYILVTDSLPDTVYQYMGNGNGDLTISFSFVGSGVGEYRFVGGNQYVYVGTGNGDYGPIIQLPLPERTDYYTARAGVKHAFAGTLMGEFRQTVHDRNLFSTIGDGNNDASLYGFSWRRPFQMQGRSNEVSVQARHRDASYDSRERIYRTDFGRSFMLPNEIVPQSNELWLDFNSTITPITTLAITPYAGRVKYENGVESNRGGMTGTFAVTERLSLSGNLGATRANRDSSAVHQEAEANTAGGQANWQAVERVDFAAGYEYDRRTNDYTDTAKGTRYNRVTFGSTVAEERFEYEWYGEDSLTSGWARTLTRNRVSLMSTRAFGQLRINSTVSYQWLERSSSSENALLARADMNYANSRKRLSVTSSYLISEETRNTRGITYIEVATGQGQFRFENGRYIPDPEGNFIEVEEILSDQSRVRRAEKTFLFNKAWDVLTLRLNSTVSEELLPSGERSAFWLLPFWSDETQPYLFYSRRYNGDIRVIPIRAGHAVSWTISETQQIRDISGVRRGRQDIDGSLALRQIAGDTYFSQKIDAFRSRRDTYYNGGGNVDGVRAAAEVTQHIEEHEISGGGGYRRATSKSGDKVNTIFATAGARLRFINKGDIRSSVEFYSQDITSSSSVLPYRLTEERLGKRGAIWSVVVNYNIRGGVRLNVNLSGRHSDNRSARIYGRGEVVTTF